MLFAFIALLVSRLSSVKGVMWGSYISVSFWSPSLISHPQQQQKIEIKLNKESVKIQLCFFPFPSCAEDSWLTWGLTTCQVDHLSHTFQLLSNTSETGKNTFETFKLSRESPSRSSGFAKTKGLCSELEQTLLLLNFTSSCSLLPRKRLSVGWSCCRDCSGWMEG